MDAVNRIPPPVLADIDGDGWNEIVLINPEFELQVFSAARREEMDTLATHTEAQEVYTPVKLATVKLVPYGMLTGRVPVALKVFPVDLRSLLQHAQNITIYRSVI